MKKLIYLSLVAIVVLSGCKGNSFITQRYTKFGHASHKTVPADKAIANAQLPFGVENAPKIEVVKNTEAEPVLVSSSSSIKENILERIPVQIYPLANSSAKFEIENHEHAKVVSKKTSQEKKQVAKKIIGTVLKIVLWIVILAVVVGVFLIIAAVA